MPVTSRSSVLIWKQERWSEDGGARMGKKVVADALEAGFGAALVVEHEDAYVFADVARTDMIRDTVDLEALVTRRERLAQSRSRLGRSGARRADRSAG